MIVPFFDVNLTQHSFKNELEKAVLTCLNKGDYINGKAVKEIESQCSKLLGIKYGISCANGTDALTVAIDSLQLETNSEIIIPSFNYVSAAECTVKLGFKPVFCDVDKSSSNTTLKDIQEKITSKTKLVIVTHLFGLPVLEIEKIALFCQSNNIYLIEDNAQSFGSSINNKMCGTFGDLSTTSFFPTKNLGCAGDGGMIFTDNDALANRLNMLKSHGQTKKYEFTIPGYNSRLDTLQAVILNIKLKHLQTHIKQRQANAKLYLEVLEEVESIALPVFKNNTFNQFTIQVKNNLRNELKEFLSSKDIQTMLYYPKPIHKQTAYQQFTNSELKNSSELCNTSLSLPIFPGLSKEEISYICSSILEFDKNFG